MGLKPVCIWFNPSIFLGKKKRGIRRVLKSFDFWHALITGHATNASAACRAIQIIIVNGMHELIHVGIITARLIRVKVIAFWK